MTVIFIIMLFFVPSYIIGQTSFAKQTSLTEKESFSNKQSVSQKKSSAEERIPFRVMSWNVENLFDTHHDTLKNDNEFLPDAIRHWNYTKYKKKLADMARVITAVGEWNPPALVGLCEVENDSVLRDLTRRSPLKELSYRYVMTSSPDLRGIDVALLYQRDLFKLLSFRSIPIPSFKHHRPTRDLLHVSGLLLTGDTLDVIVCHLPSRSGGVKESEPYRLHAARKATSRHFGSYKYHRKWGLLDHLIVSGNLLDTSSKFFTGEDKATVARLPFLLTEDKKYGDDEPFRTYKGMKYQGGISDHLPVYADFELILY